jgi:hypothetical protein
MPAPVNVICTPSLHISSHFILPTHAHTRAHERDVSGSECGNECHRPLLLLRSWCCVRSTTKMWRTFGEGARFIRANCCYRTYFHEARKGDRINQTARGASKHEQETCGSWTMVNESRRESRAGQTYRVFPQRACDARWPSASPYAAYREPWSTSPPSPNLTVESHATDS